MSEQTRVKLRPSSDQDGEWAKDVGTPQRRLSGNKRGKALASRQAHQLLGISILEPLWDDQRI